MDAVNTADRAVQCNRNTRKLKFVQWLAQTSFNFSAQPPILPSTPSQNILSGGHRSHQDTFCTFVVLLYVRDDIRLSDVTKDAPVHEIDVLIARKAPSDGTIVSLTQKSSPTTS